VAVDAQDSRQLGFALRSIGDKKTEEKKTEDKKTEDKQGKKKVVRVAKQDLETSDDENNEEINSDDENDVNEDEINKSSGLVLVDMSAESLKKRSLFKGLVFFISRECPIHILSFLLISCGASIVGWEQETLIDESTSLSPVDVDDEKITHHIVDKPPAALTKYSAHRSTRSFVQPQWVFDCLNKSSLLSTVSYAPGLICPAHLSPFSDITQDPTHAAINELMEGFEKQAADDVHKSDAPDDETIQALQEEHLRSLKTDEQDDDEDQPAVRQDKKGVIKSENKVESLKKKTIKKKGEMEFDRVSAAMNSKTRRRFTAMKKKGEENQQKIERGRM